MEDKKAFLTNFLQGFSDNQEKEAEIYKDYCKVFGDIVEAPFWEVIYNYQDTAIKTIQEMFNDLENDWIPWFIWENDLGNENRAIYIDDEAYEVTSIKQFVEVFFEVLK